MTDGVYDYPLEDGFVEMLINQRSNRSENGFYHYLQTQFAYNTSIIEGSTLTHEQTVSLFETQSITGHAYSKDILETSNHFRLFDYMLDTYNEPLSEELVLEYHRLLKLGVLENGREIAGKYKESPNIIGSVTGGIPTASVKKAPVLTRDLLSRWEENNVHGFEDIVDFHVTFEGIHPFQDGNGRIGRIIIFKEALRAHLTPWIVYMVSRSLYLNGFNAWRNDHNKIPMLQYMNQCEEIMVQNYSYFTGESEKLLQPDFSLREFSENTRSDND